MQLDTSGRLNVCLDSTGYMRLERWSLIILLTHPSPLASYPSLTPPPHGHHLLHCLDTPLLAYHFVNEPLSLHIGLYLHYVIRSTRT